MMRTPGIIFFVFLIMIGNMTKIHAQDHWIKPHGKNVQTIYFQGIFASHAQISKYTGTRGFIALTGEKVACKNAPDIVYNPFKASII